MDIINILNNYNVILENVINSSISSLKIQTYVINLITDKFRRNHIKHILNKLNINYTLVIVEKITDSILNDINNKCKLKLNKGVIGCCLSHLWCIKHAISSKYKHFLILEDDIIFHKNFETLFKQLDYDQYDMIQLGCCDFNLHSNLQNENLKDIIAKNIAVNTDKLTIYRPTKIALGAYGNIYNLSFAKMILEEKVRNFTEFDINFITYYEKYKIGICYPNLITSELSTTNLKHNYSIFNSNRNEIFIRSCFIDFKYSDYYFIWIICLEYCYYEYQKNGYDISCYNYENLIEKFSDNYPEKKIHIMNILLNNNYNINDIQEIMILLQNDKYSVV